MPKVRQAAHAGSWYDANGASRVLRRLHYLLLTNHVSPCRYAITFAGCRRYTYIKH